MTSLLPPNSTELERAIEQAMSRELHVPITDLWNPLTCPETVLPWLAWAYHVDGWNRLVSLKDKRQAIIESARLHKKKGTVWAIKRALSLSGLSDIEIIDSNQQRKLYSQFNCLKLDGSWRLDGARNLVPIELYSFTPQIQHWAEFIVKTNLAEVTNSENLVHIRELVDEWKPVRSWPLFVYRIAFVLSVISRIESASVLNKQIAMRHPWCGRVVSDLPDAQWQLGRDGDLVTLPQSFGSFKLGERRGGVSSWRLNGCRLLSNSVMSAESAVDYYRLPKVGEAKRRLNGTWALSKLKAELLSSQTVMASNEITVPETLETTFHEQIRLDYPFTPSRLGKSVQLKPWRRLNGSWQVGSLVQKRPFGFKMGRDRSIVIDAEIATQIKAEAYANPEKLTLSAPTKLAYLPRKLDGGWYVGAETKLGNFALNGRRLRANKLSRAPRMGEFHLSPNELAGFMYSGSRHLNLDGTWTLGSMKRPEFNLHIYKE